ncbi:MAG TPA: DPP IV N-terminal domain-containing protein [Candidatus Pristimantibacillus sp.]|jgi:Tol biopolymer transport system component|nr:DPP IV N-terminal domain-containing protein [Candidatus Pristimantibacillus sp.]
MNIKAISRLVAGATTTIGVLALAIPAYAAPLPPLTGNNVLFYSNRDGDNEIYMVKTDGSVQQLTANTNLQDESPSWRPQGDSFVYVSYIANTTPAQLYSMSLPSQTITQLTNDANLVYESPMYSPDGTKIVYTTSDPSSQTCIGMLTVATNTKTNLVCADLSLRQSVSLPVWSPDGTKIMYTLNDGQFNRYVYNFATQTSSLLIPGAFTGFWLPDMTKITYSRLPQLSTDTGQSFLANADGTGEQQITDSGPGGRRSNRVVATYPSGDKILMISFTATSLPEVRSLNLSDLSQQAVPQKDHTSDFASAGAVKP